MPLRLPAMILLGMCAVVAPADAQPKKPPSPAPNVTPQPDAKPDKNEKDKKKEGGDGKKVKNFDFNALDLNGRMRTPQLLYFLERANEELERASLEKRSFIPHMVRSVEEEQL